MTSNEERRDVAARLRNYENLRESFRESPICAFINALGFGGYLDWKGVCNRLADLIEPEPERTCRLSESYGIGVEFDPFEGWACDRCRMIVSHDTDKPNYCPNCGAKVVE